MRCSCSGESSAILQPLLESGATVQARILPREEWGRLSSGNGLVADFVAPEDMRVVVVEEDGQILGSMAIIRVTHLENVWFSDAAGIGVRRRLLSAARDAAKEWAHSWVMASIGDDRTGAIVERLGGIQVPVDTWLMPVN